MTQCRTPGFKLSTGEKLQIKAAFADLLDKGILTKDVSRTARWLGSRLVYLLAHALILNALVRGCRNWDSIIQGALSMSLLVSTGGRSGDIARSQCYTSVEYVKWEDVAVKLALDEHGIEVLVCDISLRYTKGNK